MRWSRHDTDASLGELMDPEPETTAEGVEATTPIPEVASDDEETQIRTWRVDHTGEPSAARPSGTGHEGDSSSDAGDSFLDDEDYLPQERRGPGRLTIALVAALVLAVGLLGGVWVQKQFGSSQSSAAAGQRVPGGAPGGQGVPGGSSGGQGVPGGAAGGQGVPGGTSSAAAGGAASQAGSGSGSGTSATPAVIGTVSSTSSKSLTVTDLGGTKHAVTISSTTTVTAPYGHSALKNGDTVAVSGSTGSDGSVNATGLTIS